MARENSDPWKRLREREDEEERTLTLFERRTAVAPTMQEEKIAQGAPLPSTDKIESLMDQAKTLLEQLNSLYRMYLAGVETRPPTERRRLLDKLIEQVLAAPKPTPGLLFKVNTLQASYNLHRDLWDRQLRDLENGKITRRTRGK